MRRLWLLLGLVIVSVVAGAESAPDDSCDIALLPAATLLLPYFEVDLEDQAGENTLITITNVTNVDQIAHITLWTDRAFPVIDFNVYLTGYDVQRLSLYDIVARGVIASIAGTGTAIHPKRGKFSDLNTKLNLTACDILPGPLDHAYVLRMQKAFLNGRVPDLGILEGCGVVGNAHDHAIGYATIDVTALCSTSLPTDPGYFTAEIRHDNVLIGDSMQVNGFEGTAEASPLVHIRAMPDAGLERTFYERLQSPSAPRHDARQPLPSRFAARWTEGTSLQIWREARTGRNATCEDYPQNATLDVSDVVVFDENENAVGSSRLATELPVTSRTSVADAERYPQMAGGATSGWMYLDLDRTKNDEVVTQNWIVGGIPLANGCAPEAAISEVTRPRGAPIAPAKSDDSCDIALLPAATLLLPYFEVDLADSDGPSTRFTITNVSPHEQIARVTLWTDLAYAVASFNIFLTGYDVHTIDLRELLARGAIGPDEGMGVRVQSRGDYSHRNLDLGPCARIPGSLPDGVVERMELAFTSGVVEDACAGGGLTHANAVGYATVDVVRNCSPNLPTSPEYWTNDLAYDNVLIGESDRTPMVHIRAIPGADFPRTFYGRYQSAQTPKRDARQPLPSAFAARWIQGHPNMVRTHLLIWREGKTGAGSTCAAHATNRMKFTESVRFDEEENAVGDIPVSSVCTPLILDITLPATSRLSAADASILPQLANGATGGWFYLNLDHCELDTHGSQNWVVTNMSAEERFSTFVDAAAMGNGCSAPFPSSEVTTGAHIIGPARKP